MHNNEIEIDSNVCKNASQIEVSHSREWYSSQCLTCCAALGTRHSALGTDAKFKTTKRISVCTISIAATCCCNASWHDAASCWCRCRAAPEGKRRRWVVQFDVVFSSSSIFGIWTALSWILANGNKCKQLKWPTVDFLIRKYGSAVSCTNRFIWTSSVAGDETVGDIFAIPIQRLNGWHKQQEKK